MNDSIFIHPPLFVPHGQNEDLLVTHVPLLESNSSAGRRIWIDQRSVGGEKLSTSRKAWESSLSGVCGLGSTEAELLVEKLGGRYRK